MSPEIGKARLWTGRFLTGVAILLLGLDVLGKFIQPREVVEATVALGYRPEQVLPIGAMLAVGVVLYAIPRSSLLGAIYLTGFLGGAVASQFRVGAPLASHVLFGTYVALLVWGGLVLRKPRILDVLRRP